MESSENVILDKQPFQINKTPNSFNYSSEHTSSNYFDENSLKCQSNQSQSFSQNQKNALQTYDHNLPSLYTPKVEKLLEQSELKKLKAWRNDSKFGDLIEGTSIIPCKAFLSYKKWMGYMEPSEWFCLKEFAENLDKRGLKISLIIDLNRSYDYYNFEDVKKECPLLSETRFLKFKLENAAVPDDKVVDEIYEILKEAHEKKEVVVMHCFNGINRTGYIVSDFLCRYYGLHGEEAVERFQKARGHKIEHACMMRKLREKYPLKN